MTDAELVKLADGLRELSERTTNVHDRELLRASFQALRVAAQQDGAWRPIETAPKDGSIIVIGGDNSSGHFFSAEARWDGAWMMFHPYEDAYTAECYQAAVWRHRYSPPNGSRYEQERIIG